jgi:Leucine carboxyl methyltransferase
MSTGRTCAPAFLGTRPDGVQMEHDCDFRWILAPSVDATATVAAAARAVAGRQADPIINDPFAEVLVDACGAELFGRLVSGDLEFADIGTDWMVDFFAARARFFDGFFAGACCCGIRQVVIVGSGLDSGSYRLDFPSGTVVYEIDRPDVVAFATCTLSRLGATPTASCASWASSCVKIGQRRCDGLALTSLNPLRGWPSGRWSRICRSMRGSFCSSESPASALEAIS